MTLLRIRSMQFQRFPGLLKALESYFDSCISLGSYQETSYFQVEKKGKTELFAIVEAYVKVKDGQVEITNCKGVIRFKPDGKKNETKPKTKD